MLRMGLVVALTSVATVRAEPVTSPRQVDPKPAAKPAKPAPKPTAKPAVKSAAKRPAAKKPVAAAARRADSRFEAPTDATTQPAYRYGTMSADDCEAALRHRKIPFVREPAQRGVFAPVRLTGPLRGVTFRTEDTDAKRATSPYEIGDCRLVLALDDFAEILANNDVVEVRHYSMYRPPEKSWPADKLASRHAGALALDAGRFILKDKTVLDVDKDFNGAIGAKTCGPDAAPWPATDKAKQLRSILCEAVGRHLFNVVLTPNYNPPHKNHFHLEVTAGVKWFLVH
ncbi:MAG: extensin family protein [Deltaproteobacteria bacterium]|nr:extensin family protein [Deltaproteobacteria bacterium]